MEPTTNINWSELPEVDEGPKKDRQERSLALAQTLTARVSTIASRLTEFNHRRARYGQLYRGALSSNATSIIEFDAVAAASMIYDTFSVQPLNIIQPIIRSVVAMVTKDRPRVRFVTTGGDDDEQHRGRMLGSYTDGTFEDSGLHDNAVQAMYHALVYGLGVVRWYIDPTVKRPKCRWVIPMELLIDPEDGTYGSNLEIHERRWYSLSALKAMYPEHAEELQEFQTLHSNETATSATAGSAPPDMLPVIETHRRPIGDRPGRHVVCTNGVTLVDEEWDEQFFPYAFIWWNKPLMGFYGIGLAEELAPAQVTVLTVMSVIRKAQNFFGAPKWVVNARSKVNRQNLNDDVANVIVHDGPPPVPLINGTTLPPDMYTYLDWIIKQAYNQAGISELNAHGTLPQGLQGSGEAQREYQDTQTARFSVISKAYMDLYVQSAKIAIALQRKASEEGGEYAKVRVSDPEGGSTVMKWSEVDLDDDRFLMRPMPSNMLPITPTGKLSGAQEMANAGLLSHEEYMSLTQFPDVDGEINSILAELRAAKAIVRRMVKDKDRSVRPDEVIQVAIQQGVAVGIYAQELRKDPEDQDSDVMLLLSDFIERCKKMATPPVPAMPPANTNGAPAQGAQPAA